MQISNYLKTQMANVIDRLCYDYNDNLYFKNVSPILRNIYDEVKTIKTSGKKGKKILIKNMVNQFSFEKKITFLDTLKIIYIIYYSGGDIPELPQGLLVLVIRGCDKLTRIPDLPDSLQILIVTNNILTSLPELPIGLQVLYCNDNLLTGLPDLPPNLSMLVGHNNCFPDGITLPERIQHKNINPRVLLRTEYYGKNKDEVDKFVEKNIDKMNRANCNCKKASKMLNKPKLENHPDLKKFKKYAYYYESNELFGKCDKYYTCGFCLESYVIEREAFSLYFKN